MSYNEKINKYRKELPETLNKFITVRYKRKANIVHTLYGRVIKIRKSSLILLQEDPESSENNITTDIGFRNIVKWGYGKEINDNWNQST